LDTAELRQAIEASSGFQSTARDHIEERLASLTTGEEVIEIDLSGMSWEFFLQDIVRRLPALDHVTAVSVFTGSRMRPEGSAAWWW
jgi:hypothetical protein